MPTPVRKDREGSAPARLATASHKRRDPCSDSLNLGAMMRPPRSRDARKVAEPPVTSRRTLCARHERLVCPQLDARVHARQERDARGGRRAEEGASLAEDPLVRGRRSASGKIHRFTARSAQHLLQAKRCEAARERQRCAARSRCADLARATLRLRPPPARPDRIPALTPLKGPRD